MLIYILAIITLAALLVNLIRHVIRDFADFETVEMTGEENREMRRRMAQYDD